MWLFTKAGFFSAVQDKTDPGIIIVRARLREDAENLQRLAAGYLETPPLILAGVGTDYEFRLRIPRDVWAGIVTLLAYGLDYSNFKDAVHETPDTKGRNSAYTRVWAIMANWQASNLPKPPEPEWQRWPDGNHTEPDWTPLPADWQPSLWDKQRALPYPADWLTYNKVDNLTPAGKRKPRSGKKTRKGGQGASGAPTSPDRRNFWGPDEDEYTVDRRDWWGPDEDEAGGTFDWQG